MPWIARIHDPKTNCERTRLQIAQITAGCPLGSALAELRPALRNNIKAVKTPKFVMVASYAGFLHAGMRTPARSSNLPPTP
jgi:hypothetical protein